MFIKVLALSEYCIRANQTNICLSQILLVLEYKVLQLELASKIICFYTEERDKVF